MSQETKPDFVTDEHLEYLDELRESGDTNMFGAGPYLESAFPELAEGHKGFGSSQKTKDVLGYWMKSFGKRMAAKEAK